MRLDLRQKYSLDLLVRGTDVPEGDLYDIAQFGDADLGSPTFRDVDMGFL